MLWTQKKWGQEKKGKKREEEKMSGKSDRKKTRGTDETLLRSRGTKIEKREEMKRWSTDAPP